jgi:hypothetical protein
MARNLNMNIECRLALGKLKRFFGDYIPTEVELSEAASEFCHRYNLPAIFIVYAFSSIEHKGL